MPPVRTLRGKKAPPPGFSDIEDTLLEYTHKMRDATALSHDGKKKHEAQWPIFQINHARSRYIYDLYYTREAISKVLYEWLIKNGYADGALIAKWKKMGYEKLCCLRCVQTKETNFGGSCVCRVPKAQMRETEDGGAEGEKGDEGGEKTKRAGGGGGGVQCVSCGCRGCASSD